MMKHKNAWRHKNENKESYNSTLHAQGCSKEIRMTSIKKRRFPISPRESIILVWNGYQIPLRRCLWNKTLHITQSNVHHRD